MIPHLFDHSPQRVTMACTVLIKKLASDDKAASGPHALDFSVFLLTPPSDSEPTGLVVLV